MEPTAAPSTIPRSLTHRSGGRPARALEPDPQGEGDQGEGDEGEETGSESQEGSLHSGEARRGKEGSEEEALHQGGTGGEKEAGEAAVGLECTYTFMRAADATAFREVQFETAAIS